MKAKIDGVEVKAFKYCYENVLALYGDQWNNEQVCEAYAQGLYQGIEIALSCFCRRAKVFMPKVIDDVYGNYDKIAQIAFRFDKKPIFDEILR